MHSSAFLTLVASALAVFAAPQAGLPSGVPSGVPSASAPIVTPVEPSGPISELPHPIPSPTQPGSIEPCILVVAPTNPVGIPSNGTVSASVEPSGFEPPTSANGTIALPSATPSSNPGEGNCGGPVYIYYSIGFAYTVPTPTPIDGNEPFPAPSAALPSEGPASEDPSLPSEVSILPTEAPSPSDGLPPVIVTPTPTTFSCALNGPLPPSATVIFPGAGNTPLPIPFPPSESIPPPESVPPEASASAEPSVPAEPSVSILPTATV